MVGSALVCRLEAEGFTNVLKRDRSQLDLTDESAVAKFFADAPPDVVVVAAAKVGGIKTNNEYPVEFLLENLRIQNNIIRSAFEAGVRKLLFLGSSCIYPKFAPQPIPETVLLTGPRQPTNKANASARIAETTLCETNTREYGATFASVCSPTFYGPND